MPDPTRADSLNLLQNSLAIENFYANHPSKDYKITSAVDLDPAKAPEIFKYLDEASRKFTNKYSNKEKTADFSEKAQYSSNANKIIDPRFYRQDVNKDVFKQRDVAHGAVNFDAPFSLYNRNIAPQQYVNRMWEGSGPGDVDVANYAKYDPLAVSPADTLTDKQLIKRASKFGTTGIPKSKIKSLGLKDAAVKPRSNASLEREEKRRILREKMAKLGYSGDARKIMKEGSPESVAWNKYLASNERSQTPGVRLPNQVKSPVQATKQPVVNPPVGEDHYYMTKDLSRDGDIMDYHYKEWNPAIDDYIDKRITKDEYLKNTRQPKQQSRSVRAEFAYGGNVPKYGAGGLVNQGVDAVWGLFGDNESAAADIVSGTAGAVAGYFTGNYGEMIDQGGEAWGGVAKATEDSQSDFGQGLNKFSESAESSSHMVGKYMQGDIAGGSQWAGEATRDFGQMTGNQDMIKNTEQLGNQLDKGAQVVAPIAGIYGQIQGMQGGGQGMQGGLETGAEGYQSYMKYGGNVPDGDKTGMMKARIAYADAFGNPAGERMTSPNPMSYDFGDGSTGTHFMSSVDNYAVPKLQEENGKLNFKDYSSDSKEAIRFENAEDANYFAKHYKDVAPMSRKAYGGNVYGHGGPVYEAEGGEVIDGGNPTTLQGGHISPNSSTSGKINGNSHANGGVKMTGGEKIYSDRLTVDPSFLKDLDI